MVRNALINENKTVKKAERIGRLSAQYIRYYIIFIIFYISFCVMSFIGLSFSINNFLGAIQNHSFFNNPFNNSRESSFNVYFTEDGPIINKVLDFMRCSKNFLFVSALDVSHPDILNQLYQLKENGLDVRIVTEKSVLGLPSKIDFSKGLHHVKFMVNECGVIFGSANFSESGLVSGFNDIIFFPTIFSDRFKRFFLKIWEEGVVTKVDGFLVSPIDKVEESVVKLLSRARKRIWVCVYAFSDMNILSMLKYKGSCGIDVKIVVDKWIYSGRLGKMPLENTKVITSRMLHHKFIIVDNTLITGSTNYTESGFHKNVEMIWITKNKQLVRKFENVFKRLYY